MGWPLMATFPPGNLEPGRTDAYVPTDDISAFIEARGGTCRRADCTVPTKQARTA